MGTGTNFAKAAKFEPVPILGGCESAAEKEGMETAQLSGGGRADGDPRAAGAPDGDRRAPGARLASQFGSSRRAVGLRRKRNRGRHQYDGERRRPSNGAGGSL